MIVVLPDAGVAADDDEAAAVADHLVEQGTQPGPLVGPSDQVLGPAAPAVRPALPTDSIVPFTATPWPAVTECLAEAVRVVRVAGCRSH